MKLLQPYHLLIPFFTLALTACNENEGDKTLIKTSLTITGSSQESVAYNPFEHGLNLLFPKAIALAPPLLQDSNGSIVTLNEAWIVLKKIQFKPQFQEKANEVEEIIYKGPFVINLLHHGPKSLGDIELPVRSIRRVKMLLHKAQDLPLDAPEELAGNSIYLRGTVNGVEFRFAADETTDFVIKGEEEVVPYYGKELLMVIRIADLFKKIDLSALTSATTINRSDRLPSPTPCPEIKSSASDIYTCFISGINSEAKFGVDNGDKDLTYLDEVIE